MNTSYYHSLSAGLSRLEGSLPEGLESEERTAVQAAEYNPNPNAGSHNYTPNNAEHNFLTSNGWKDEGIAWSGLK